MTAPPPLPLRSFNNSKNSNHRCHLSSSGSITTIANTKHRQLQHHHRHFQYQGPTPLSLPLPSSDTSENITQILGFDMDSAVGKMGIIKGSKKYGGVLRPEKNVKVEEEVEEKRRLLPWVKSRGGTSGRRKRGAKKRRVQWNDRNGRELVKVLEFEWSDSSDSDDGLDSCISCHNSSSTG